MIETLIEKLESAKEGSEELDREINEVLGWKHLPPYKLGLRRFKERWIKGIETSWFVPRYTTSVDEALTTFPEDGRWMYTLSHPGRVPGGCIAKACADIHWIRPPGGNCETGLAETMPLAICVASLKARVENGT